MNDKKPTPIPLRASRKKAEPQPLTFPQPDRNIHVSQMHPVPDFPLAGTELRNYIADCIAQALFKTAMQMTEVEIIEMGLTQFEAFVRSILEDAE